MHCHCNATLPLLLAAGLMVTGCATSNSADCTAHLSHAKGTRDGDTAETIDYFLSALRNTIMRSRLPWLSVWLY